MPTVTHLAYTAGEKQTHVSSPPLILVDRKQLQQGFYARSARVVARDLLGCKLVHRATGVRLAGMIVETEAYCDSDEADLACHGTANEGRPTPRTAVMFGPPGYAYVYFTYGMHWMFNVVTGEEGVANAVLVRALKPLEGTEVMLSRRQRPFAQLTDGPAKLTQAMGIDKTLDGANLCETDSVLWIEAGEDLRDAAIASGPRIGLGTTPEPWKSVPWRYWIKRSQWVSK